MGKYYDGSYCGNDVLWQREPSAVYQKQKNGKHPRKNSSLDSHGEPAFIKEHQTQKNSSGSFTLSPNQEFTPKDCTSQEESEQACMGCSDAKLLSPLLLARSATFGVVQ